MRKIKKGECKGLKEINENIIEKQENQARSCQNFPTKDVVSGKFEIAKMTPPWCCGDIERCPAPCGACQQVSDAGTRHGMRIGYKKIFNVNAPNAINAVLAQKF